MSFAAGIEWSRLFGIQTPLLEIVIRGSVTYLALWTLLRFSFRREVGSLGITNLLVIVLIADASQNAMSGDYSSLTDGILLVATIVAWSFGLDWLAFRFPRLGWFVHPPPLRLVRDGRLLRRNLRQELISEEELMSHLRLQGIERVEDVKEAFIEPDGRISVIGRRGEGGEQGPRERRAV